MVVTMVDWLAAWLEFQQVEKMVRLKVHLKVESMELSLVDLTGMK
jgi:hypothetical protein